MEECGMVPASMTVHSVSQALHASKLLFDEKYDLFYQESEAPKPPESWAPKMLKLDGHEQSGWFPFEEEIVLKARIGPHAEPQVPLGRVAIAQTDGDLRSSL